jgi:hypothetical protein
MNFKECQWYFSVMFYGLQLCKSCSPIARPVSYLTVLGDGVSIPSRKKRLFTTASTPALRPTQPPCQCVSETGKAVGVVKLVAYPGILFGGVQQLQLRTKGRENGDLGAVAPSQGFHSICKWIKPVFLLGCYGCIFHGTGNSAQLR